MVESAVIYTLNNSPLSTVSSDIHTGAAGAELGTQVLSVQLLT